MTESNTVALLIKGIDNQFFQGMLKNFEEELTGKGYSFVLQTVGVFYLKDDILGIIILVSIYISNTIIGIIYRGKNHPTKVNYITNINKSQSFMNVFSNSIKKSINTLLMISGIVTSFLIISTLNIYQF